MNTVFLECMALPFFSLSIAHFYPLALSHTHTCMHTNTQSHAAASCGELMFAANHLKAVTIITDVRVHSGATGAAGSSFSKSRLVHRIESGLHFMSASVSRGCLSCSQLLRERVGGRRGLEKADSKVI